jgi:hypothetical protein
MKSNLLEKIRQSQEMKNVEEYMNLNENSYPLPVNQGSNDHPIINSNNSFIEVQFNFVITLVILSVTIIALLIITFFYKYLPDKYKSRQYRWRNNVTCLLPIRQAANNLNSSTRPQVSAPIRSSALFLPSGSPPSLPNNKRHQQSIEVRGNTDNASVIFVSETQASSFKHL